MSVGERIQYYRKKLGLSQEELGQRLLVSRQTVSLWENDQTVPTIDNLLRLKEIFGVTVDEILSAESNESENESNTEVCPLEEYNYVFSPDDIKALKKYYFAKTTRVLFISLSVITLTCLAYVLINMLNDSHIFLAFIAFTAALLLGIYFFTKYKFNNNWNKENSRLIETLHEYKIFNGFIDVSVYNNSELQGTTKVYFDRINKIHDLGNFKLMEIDNQLFPISLNDFNSSAFFNQYLSINPNKLVNEEKNSKWKTLSIFFIIISVFSVLFVIPLILALMSVNYFESEQAPMSFNVVYSLALLPVSSIVFGIIALFKKYKTKKNIIIGIICVVLVCFSSATFGMADQSINKGLIAGFEEETGYDLPDAISVYSSKETDLEEIDVYDLPEGTAREGWYCSFDIDEIEGRHFARKIEDDPNWLTEAPEEYKKIFGLETDFKDAGYFLAYNTVTGEYNKLPSEDGTYMFYNVSYDYDNQLITIEEYYVNFKAE